MSTIRALGKGTVEVAVELDGGATTYNVPASDIISFRALPRYGSDPPSTRIYFKKTSCLKSILDMEHRHNYSQEDLVGMVPYVHVQDSVASLRIQLRKAMGFSEEEISEELGMELLSDA